MGIFDIVLFLSVFTFLSNASTLPTVVTEDSVLINVTKREVVFTPTPVPSTSSVKPLRKTTIPIVLTPKTDNSPMEKHAIKLGSTVTLVAKKPRVTTPVDRITSKITDVTITAMKGTEPSNVVTEVTKAAIEVTTSVKENSTKQDEISVQQVNGFITILSSATSSTTESNPADRGYPARTPTRLDERLQALDCDIPLLPAESRLWRGNETHELMLPITIPEECPAGSSPGGDEECLPMVLSWEGAAEVQSGDILLVRIDDAQLTLANAAANHTVKTTDGDRMHHAPMTAVYQVTRQGHEHCDVTEGVLLDITPLLVDGKKLVTLYDKDLTEGVNLLIVVSENWGSQCVRLKVTVKSDNCGDNQDCSEKGVCYSNISMEGYECQCCPGFVGPHCEEQDACFPSPCTNNGICVDISQGHDGATYQCLCPYGYTGKNCQEEVDPCSSSPCQNGATCSGNVTQFRCDCQGGFSGLLCQHALNECESSPCVHGICMDQDDGYRCFCQPGFAGQHCEYEYNECESSPCLNGGTCTDHVGAYICTCGRGYTGKRCHIKVDLCSPNPCSLHHYCVDRGNNYSCECPRGYAGSDCLMPAIATCNTNPCANGGTCWSSVDSFYCACRPGYTGKTCEDDFIVESVGAAQGAPNGGGGGGGGSVREVRLPLALYHDRLHNVYIAAGTLGAAMAIVGVVVTACHCRVNKTYQRWITRLWPGRGPQGGGGPPHHWLSDKQAPPAPHPHAHPHPHPHHARPALPPIDTQDMYYTLDFSDSQSSPLIQ